MLVLDLFFFQAEDGIRDLVRSRGLGDVYKRQSAGRLMSEASSSSRMSSRRKRWPRCATRSTGCRAVSYTHLTLPTSDLV